MSLVSKLGLNQIGGYVKGQKSSTDPKGYRVFVVYTIVDGERIPLYKDNNEDLKEMKIFRGKSPKEVAKKVVTEICQMIKKTDPTGYKKVCKAVSNEDLKKREKELMSVESLVTKDAKKAGQQINWSRYPGFEFEIRDTMNTTTDSIPRHYHYYGERVKLDNPKKYKGNKFAYESQVIPIRKDYNLAQALIDHVYKSDKAIMRYNTTQNFSKHRSSKQNSRKVSKKSKSLKKSKSRSGSRSNSRNTDKKNLMKQQILSMASTDISRKCQKGRQSWKVEKLDEILYGLGISSNGSKTDKCQRILSYYKAHRKQ